MSKIINSWLKKCVLFRFNNTDSGWLQFCTWPNRHHDDVIKWKHFRRYWPFVRGVHWSPVNSLHKGPWRGALMITLICARINGWANNGEADGLRRNFAHYDVIVMGCVVTSEITIASCDMCKIVNWLIISIKIGVKLYVEIRHLLNYWIKKH